MPSNEEVPTDEEKVANFLVRVACKMQKLGQI